MNTKQIHAIRSALAFGLMLNGVKLSDIRAILKTGTKEKARRLVARGRRNEEAIKRPGRFWLANGIPMS